MLQTGSKQCKPKFTEHPKCLYTWYFPSKRSNSTRQIRFNSAIPFQFGDTNSSWGYGFTSYIRDAPVRFFGAADRCICTNWIPEGGSQPDLQALHCESARAQLRAVLQRWLKNLLAKRCGTPPRLGRRRGVVFRNEGMWLWKYKGMIDLVTAQWAAEERKGR